MKASSAWLFILVAVIAFATSAQTPVTPKDKEIPAAPTCNHERALLLVQEQLADAKVGDKPEARIRLHLTAADLMWLHRRDSAREWFEAAWKMSRDFFKEQGLPKEKAGNFSWFGEDLRFVVIKAIARRDQSWSQRLLKDLLDEQKAEFEKKKSLINESDMVYGVFNLANSLLDIDKAMAVQVAREMISQPATTGVTRFLLGLAETDQTRADALCVESIAAQTTTQGLFSLSAYVFGTYKPIGIEQLVFAVIPPNFKPNAQLQRTYVNAVLQRAKAILSNPAVQEAAGGMYSLSEAAQMLTGLYGLETLVNQTMPSLIPAIIEARQGLSSLVEAGQLNTIQNVLEQRKPQPVNSFARQLRSAEDAKTSGEKDRLIMMAVMNNVETESDSDLISAVLKINKLTTRAEMFDWLYFNLTQKANRQGDYNLAIKTADKVTALEQRAYLLYEISSTLLEKLDDRVRATDSLQAASKVAERAPDTNEKARAFIGIGSAYAKFDRQMAFESIRSAVKTINQLKEPDVQSSNIYQTIEGDGFVHGIGYQVKGFDLNGVFQALGKLDFEQALSAARELDDKTLRAEATIALCAECLSQLPPKAPAAAKK